MTERAGHKPTVDKTAAFTSNDVSETGTGSAATQPTMRNTAGRAAPMPRGSTAKELVRKSKALPALFIEDSSQGLGSLIKAINTIAKKLNEI